MNLKSILKSFKLNESTISMVLGIVVVLVVGVLVINYFKGLDSGSTLPIGEQAEVEGPTITRNGRTFHIVQENDNLWKIAERYYDSGYNWIDIANENELSNPGLIETGEELEIPDVEPKIATVTVTTNVLADTDSNEPIVGATYEVIEGDSLWDIAVRAYGDGYRWVEISKENSLDNPNVIHTGNVLTLPR